MRSKKETATETRRTRWIKYYMEEDGMTMEQAQNAARAAEEYAQEEAHEAWIASLDPDEHPWVDNPD